MLSKKEIKNIKEEIVKAANNHLNATTAEQALNNFTNDIIAVSNEQLFTSFEMLAKDVNEYYDSLKRVNHAGWKDLHIHVISKSAATFTAKFKFGFTDKNDKSIELQGVWTALFVLINDKWKIRLRHESFSG